MTLEAFVQLLSRAATPGKGEEIVVAPDQVVLPREAYLQAVEMLRRVAAMHSPKTGGPRMVCAGESHRFYPCPTIVALEQVATDGYTPPPVVDTSPGTWG